MGGFLDLLSDHFVADLTIELEQPYRNAKWNRSCCRCPDVKGIEAWSGASAEILEEDGSLASNLYIIAPPAESELIVRTSWLDAGLSRANPMPSLVSDGMLDLFPDLKPGRYPKAGSAG